MTTDLPFRRFADVGRGLEAELSMLNEVALGGAPASALLWEAAVPALVLPSRFARYPGFDAASGRLTAAGWPVITRATGGGITPQGPGVINVALAFRPPPETASIKDGYAAICDPLIEAFGSLGILAGAGAVAGSFCDGDYNLEVAGRKIVGTAQRWRRGTVLAHALILVDLDLAGAVAAAQALADGLDLGDRYNADVHTSVADLLPELDAPRTALATAIGAVLVRSGYRQTGSI